MGSYWQRLSRADKPPFDWQILVPIWQVVTVQAREYIDTDIESTRRITSVRSIDEQNRKAYE